MPWRPWMLRQKRGPLPSTVGREYFRTAQLCGTELACHTFEEIERDWFGDAHLSWDRDDVVRAFGLAESIRGREWVLGGEVPAAFPNAFSGIGPRGGYQECLRIYWFGKRAASIVGAENADDLIQRLLANDSAASEEASASIGTRQLPKRKRCWLQ
jgi:hypothetical protein